MASSDRPVGMSRCPWSEGVDEQYLSYHDTEWGVPVRDDRRHFEFLILESAQAGLSWRTILNKRDGYRRAFAGFDPERVARFNRRSVERLVADPGIVRNRRKIEAAIGNARHYLAIQEEFGSFTDYVWRFVGGEPIVNAHMQATGLVNDHLIDCFRYTECAHRPEGRSGGSILDAD